MPKDVKQFLLKLTLNTQGTIKGGGHSSKGSLDQNKGIICHSFDYEVTSQFDAGSGALTGRRQHQPITIVREVDEASPLLWQALCSNEGFKTATLSFVRPSKTGKETVYQTIELTKGTISKIDHAAAVNGKKCQAITLQYEELAVNGVKNGIISHSLLG